MAGRAILAVALFAALTACDQGIDNERVRADIIEDNPRPISVAQMPMSAASLYLRNATAQGLVGFDAQGRVIPGLASRWIVTDDDRSYIFRLQKTRWNNGREIRSEEVAAALRNRIAELRSGRFASELAVVDDVVSMTGKVIEIRLRAPMPNLLELLAQPEFGLIQKGSGTGPMQAKKRGTAMALQMRIDEADGSISLDGRTITMRGTKASEALARFATGQSDILLNGRFEHAPLLTANTVIGAAPQIDPTPGLFGLIFEAAGPFLSVAANREAIAAAIDRPRMLTTFDVGTWRETLTLSPETLGNRGDVARPSWTSLNMQDRKQFASQTIANWKASSGPVRPLRIAMPRGVGARILFARLRTDLAAVGLEAERVGPQQSADLRLVDAVADTSSPAWYLSQLSCAATTICSSKADRLVAEARLATDRDERKRLLAEAETELQTLRNFIPIAHPLRWSITREGLLGFAPNPRGIHPLQYLGRDPT
jgi:ABC-type transport system substrate-binding protein